MRHGWIAVVLLAPACVTGQVRWTPPHTPDGQPDFQGIWTNATITPLERPPEFAGKVFLTEREAAELERRTLEEVNSDRRDGGNTADLRRNYNEFWRDRGTTVIDSRRTSLIVDPPDGRVPALTPEARKRQAARAAASRSLSGPEDLHFRVRCITRGLPMLPTPNNNFFQILQAPGYVVILQEMMYEARVIPLDARPHAPPNVRGWMGDPRGRWEGDTLVIDTTNFSSSSEFQGSHEGLHLVERLTRTGPGSILYEFSVDDPSTFTRPWSVAMPMRKTEERLFVYECHEGNYTMVGVLAGARAEEKRAAEAAAKTGSK